MDSNPYNSSTKFVVSATLNVVLAITLAIVGFLLFDANRTIAGKEADLAAARQDVLLAKTETATATARVAEIKSDLTKVQTQADQASSRSDELAVSLQQESARAEATAVARDAEKARAEATAAALDAEKARLPSVPVRVEFRKAALNNTLVGVFINTSSKHLHVVVAMRNTTTGRVSRMELQLAPGGRSEIGHLEGWGFSSGDEVAIVSAGYEVGKVTTP
jgi:hypothetical protein